MTAFGSGVVDDGSPHADSLLADLSASLALTSEYGEASATLFASAGDTSVSGLRSGLLSVRWPGTPWIGCYAGVSRPGLFAPGLYEPLVDHGWIGPDSLFTIGLTSDGFLGTRLELAEYVLPSDTVEVFSVGSPWLGFCAVDYWSCSGIDSAGLPSSVRSLSGAMDLRFVQPWFVLASTGEGSDSGAVLVELRGLRLPSPSPGGRLLLVPRASFAGSAAEAPGGAFQPGRRIVGGALDFVPEGRALGWSVYGEYSIDDPGSSRGSGSFFMISQAGIEYAVRVDSVGQGEPASMLRIVYRRSSASCGGEASVDGDSLRVAGLAGYSPLRGVSALLRISADADDSPDPSAELETSACMGPVQGILRLAREDGETVFSITARAVLR
jgi:hypothetical protein